MAYRSGERAMQALAGVSLEVAPLDRLVLLGRSGSGKTTLLHVLGGLVEPQAGDVEWHGQPLGRALVFQSPNLLPYFTVFENVAFASQLAGHDVDDAAALLDLVGLRQRYDHLPSELSGGEAQRAAIARALVQRPELLLCDEPTGHLDTSTAERVLELIDSLQREALFAVVIATHDADVAARYDRELLLEDGVIVGEAVN